MTTIWSLTGINGRVRWPNDQASAARSCFWRRVGWNPLATSTLLAEFIVVEPTSLVVAEGDLPEKLHANQGTRNDFFLIDVLAVVVWVGWDLNVDNPPHLDLSK